MKFGKDVSSIVELTLSRMDVREFAWVKLVKGTFAAETHLEELFDEDTDCYGFMMMHRDFFVDVLRSTIAPNKKLQEKIKLATSVDVATGDLNSLLWALKTNLAFQVAITYCAYTANYLLSPNDNLEDLSGYYTKFWLDDPKAKAAKARFIENYQELFNLPTAEV